MTNRDVEELFEPRGLNKRGATQGRADGWVGGRAHTWHGHYRENPASRAGADSHRMASDAKYAAAVAEELRRRDATVPHGDSVGDGLEVEPVSPGIGTVVQGVDMATLTDAQANGIWNLLMERKVVFLRDQGHITRDEHIAFAKRFAETGLAFGRQHALAASKPPSEYPEILRLYSDEARPFAASNWHSDVTWSDRPPLGSVLLARKAPPVGGDTVFVDCIALWDSLNSTLKEFLEGRTATHGRRGNDEVEHPVCRTHPVTGKNALYINPTFTNSICGMEPADSARLLARLYAKMYSTPEHTCRFPWRDGSVAMWDNRSCQHYAVSDFWPHERLMERVTLVDPSEEDEVPFWLDANGERHYSVMLASREAIDTPLGYA
ncbi:MAG: TauD/TfdA family dioxygenase [Gammaproteobacteria bacterium]|nr:TauD/TfdA family dioxygenase [Gammaproteobacteria bacterium]